MPPLKTFVFESKKVIGLEIKTRAYEKISALWQIEKLGLNIEDFKLK
jgi:hypothetical protein